MEFGAKPERLRNLGADVFSTRRMLNNTSSEIMEVAKVLSKFGDEYHIVNTQLTLIMMKADETGDAVSGLSSALVRIGTLYRDTEKAIVTGKMSKSKAKDAARKNKNSKESKDFWHWLGEKLGIKHDKFKGVPDWMEVLGWLNRQMPWSWLFFTATREGWLDEFFDAVDFEKDSDGIYHVNTDKYDVKKVNELFGRKVITDENGICWQQFGGYTDLYDQVFDFFCDMEADKSLTFRTESGEEYTLWRWKGDYLNLGAGGEIGIYKGEGDLKQCAVHDELKINMHVDYGDGTSSDYCDETWWATSFNPQKQNYRAEDITITYTIDFSDADPELWNGFQDSCGNRPDVVIDAANKTAIIVY